MIRAALAFTLLSAQAAQAIEVTRGDPPARVDVTTTSIAGWHANNGNLTSCDDAYAEGIERLNLNGSWGTWVAALRLDGSLYLSRPDVREGPGVERPCHAVELTSRYRNAVIPEKASVGWNGRLFEITAGDSYVSFGRGMALSLRKTDELGLDTTQRGALARVHGERVSATLLAGFTNINNLDEASGRSERDPNDLVLGTEGEVRITDGIRLGAHAAGFAFHAPVTSYSALGGGDAYAERWLNTGPVIDARGLTPWLGVYLEGLMQRRIPVDALPERGFGAYGSATVKWKQLTVLLEGKSYGDLEVVQPRFGSVEFDPVQYSALPTLERLLQPLEHSQREVRGGRLRADWSLSDAVAIYVNHGFFRDAEGYLDPDTVAVKPGLIHDPYAGIDVHVGQTRLQGEAGWRVVLLKDVATPARSDGHLDVDVVQAFDGGFAVELHAVHWERRKLLPFLDERWREGTLSLGVRRRPPFSITAILDYTTEEGQPKVWHPGGAAEWEFSHATNLRLFVGSSRGGLRCVSGVCRVFPAFEGAKATFTARF